MKAWELLSDESKWCQTYMARNKKGRSVSYANPEAVCWCAVGALMKCYLRPEDCSENIQKLEQSVGTAVRWNDSSSYKTVHSTLKRLDI